MCDCQHNSGLSAVTGRPVHVGAPFALGVEFADWWLDTSFKELNQVLIEIQSALAQSGYISGQVKAYELSGYLNPFVVIEGYSGREYGSDQHLKDAVLSVVSSIYPSINYGSVTYSVETYDSQSGQTQTLFQSSPIAQSGSSSNPLNAIGQTIGNTFKTDATTGLIIGVVGTIAAIVILKKL